MGEQRAAAVELEPTSSAFEDAFLSGGSIVSECLCGRTNFADSERAGTWEEGELEELRRRSKDEPDKCIAHLYDSVGTTEIGLVIGCPCNGLRRYENFIWAYREEITKYLKARAKADLLTAALNARAGADMSVELTIDGEKA